MDYNVVITSDAEKDLDSFIHYLLFEKKNEQAASSVLDDFEKTKQILSVVVRYAIQRCSCCIKKLNFYGLWRNKELCQNDTIAPGTFIEPWNVNILLS